MKVFGIAGHSGMGKTTLLERLVPEISSRGLVVSLIKHSHKNIEIDRPGKDSYRLREAGLQRGAAAGQRPLGADARTARRRRAAAGLPARPHAALRPGADRGLQERRLPEAGGLARRARQADAVAATGRVSWPLRATVPRQRLWPTPTRRRRGLRCTMPRRLPLSCWPTPAQLERPGRGSCSPSRSNCRHQRGSAMNHDLNPDEQPAVAAIGHDGRIDIDDLLVALPINNAAQDAKFLGSS
ncbi:MAG: molybdopterin-guanine dinucleotide biosynthesis protein B [Desulfosudis oleivorans]|nr:molybdopterin-guanine dinucleotide biosynthesis protein B [Desulfosudis oleivorans]